MIEPMSPAIDSSLVASSLATARWPRLIHRLLRACDVEAVVLAVL